MLRLNLGAYLGFVAARDGQLVKCGGTPSSERWCVNTEDFNESGRVYLELVDATPAETERAMRLLKKLVG